MTLKVLKVDYCDCDISGKSSFNGLKMNHTLSCYLVDKTSEVWRINSRNFISLSRNLADILI